MKKSKLIGLAALMLSLGAVGCGDKGGEVEPCEKHTWGNYEVVTDATCTAVGSKKRKCEVCGTEETKEISKKSHSYQKVDAESTASTCQAKGKEVKKCSVCGDKTEKELDFAAHTMVDYTPEASDTEHVVVAATCEAAGKHFQKCSVCNTIEEVTDNALGHLYAKVSEESEDDAVVWTKEANCTEAGEGSKTCTRQGCGHVEPVTKAALGHDLQLVGGEQQAAAGKATVRLYSCSRECGTEYLGFSATEVTEESAATLYKVTNGTKEGYRFFGHPIGNDVALDEEGSASESAHVAVYNKQQKGDFFEYVFDLTKEQADKLQNCKLYCEATPSNYMQSNNVDFWRVKGDASSDWTYGMYIDDAPEHAATDNGDGTFTGVVVEDFRYVLYVDDVLKTMDSTVDTPSGANGSIGEYVLPYTFQLHEGENKIRLVMAGGYRSVFYNFTFRPVEDEPEEPEPVVHTHSFVFGAAAAGGEGECDRSIGYCTGCGKEVIKIASGKDLNGNLVQDNKLPKGSGGSYDGTKISKYVFNAAAGAGEIYAEAAFDSYGNGARSFYDGKEGGSNAFPLSGGKTNTVMTLNAANVTLPTKTYTELGLGETENVFKMMKIADATFVEGANEFTMTATNSYGLKYKSLIFVTNKAHAHNFVDGTCACGLKRIVVAASSPTDGSLSSDKLQKGTSGSYDGTNGVKYTVTMPAAATVELQAKVWVDSGANWTEANGYSYYTGKVSGSTVKVLSDGSTNTVMKVNGANVTMPTTTYYAMGIRGTTAADAGIASYGSFNFTEGDNTFELAATNSYGLCYGEFYILYR